MSEDPARPREDAELPERSEDGVDLTLIRRMLSLTPRERLLVAQQAANSILELRARMPQS